MKQNDDESKRSAMHDRQLAYAHAEDKADAARKRAPSEPADPAKLPGEIEAAMKAFGDAAFYKGDWIPNRVTSLAYRTEQEVAALAALRDAIKRYGDERYQDGMRDEAEARR